MRPIKLAALSSQVVTVGPVGLGSPPSRTFMSFGTMIH